MQPYTPSHKRHILQIQRDTHLKELQHCRVSQKCNSTNSLILKLIGTTSTTKNRQRKPCCMWSKWTHMLKLMVQQQQQNNQQRKCCCLQSKWTKRCCHHQHRERKSQKRKCHSVQSIQTKCYCHHAQRISALADSAKTPLRGSTISKEYIPLRVGWNSMYKLYITNT